MRYRRIQLLALASEAIGFLLVLPFMLAYFYAKYLSEWLGGAGESMLGVLVLIAGLASLIGLALIFAGRLVRRRYSGVRNSGVEAVTEEELQNLLWAHAVWVETRGASGLPADLSGADLRGVGLPLILEGIAWGLHSLREAGEADIPAGIPVDLREAVLRDADLRGVSFQRPGGGGVLFVDADLSGANLDEACLTGVNLTGAILREASLRDTQLLRARLLGGDLRGATFVGADLRGADLLKARLTGARFQGADLRGVNLQKAEGLTVEQVAAARSLAGATLDAGLLEAVRKRHPELLVGPSTWRGGSDEAGGILPPRGIA